MRIVCTLSWLCRVHLQVQCPCSNALYTFDLPAIWIFVRQIFLRLTCVKRGKISGCSFPQPYQTSDCWMCWPLKRAPDDPAGWGKGLSMALPAHRGRGSGSPKAKATSFQKTNADCYSNLCSFSEVNCRDHSLQFQGVKVRLVRISLVAKVHTMFTHNKLLPRPIENRATEF